jgi:hypothetical protein
MKTLIFTLLLLTSVSHANPAPRLECSSDQLEFMHVHLSIAPDAYSPSATVYVQSFGADVKVIENVPYKTLSGEGVKKNSYVKNGEISLIRSTIDGEDLGWRLTVNNMGITDVPMDCKQVVLVDVP